MQRPAGGGAAGHRRRPRGFPDAGRGLCQRALRGHAVVQRLHPAAGEHRTHEADAVKVEAVTTASGEPQPGVGSYSCSPRCGGQLAAA